ncbi:MAG: ATP/GTP-binding protein [Bacteriovoracia bacterium]
MSFVNHSTKEINCKIVYFGCGLGGKTTNLQYVYDSTAENQKTKLITLSGENERTLFFDFLPLDVGNIRGFNTRFHLYTVPGQSFYEVSKQFLLKGVDGIVFVVDSQQERWEANLESLQSLESSLEFHGYDLKKIPKVVQYNKRDTQTAVPVAELSRAFNKWNSPEFEAVANKGEGVFETLTEITKIVILDLKNG